MGNGPMSLSNLLPQTASPSGAGLSRSLKVPPFTDPYHATLYRHLARYSNWIPLAGRLGKFTWPKYIQRVTQWSSKHAGRYDIIMPTVMCCN